MPCTRQASPLYLLLGLRCRRTASCACPPQWFVALHQPLNIVSWHRADCISAHRCTPPVQSFPSGSGTLILTSCLTAARSFSFWKPYVSSSLKKESRPLPLPWDLQGSACPHWSFAASAPPCRSRRQCAMHRPPFLFWRNTSPRCPLRCYPGSLLAKDQRS